MKFRDLTDEEWETIKRHLPPAAKTGRPRADDRKTINGIIYVLETGCKWEDMPERYGSYKTAWRRHKQLSENWTWKSIMDALISKGYSSGMIKMNSLSIDSSTIPAKKGASL